MWVRQCEDEIIESEHENQHHGFGFGMSPKRATKGMTSSPGVRCVDASWSLISSVAAKLLNVTVTSGHLLSSSGMFQVIK